MSTILLAPILAILPFCFPDLACRHRYVKRTLEISIDTIRDATTRYCCQPPPSAWYS